jgi:hypothetical protein
MEAPSERWASLPGADMVFSGMEDLSQGKSTVAALLVSVGAPRLSRLGRRIENPIPSPEHRLYQTLSREASDGAHARYNALIRRLVSFERAAECAS